MNNQLYQVEVGHEDDGFGHTFSDGQEDSLPIYDVLSMRYSALPSTFIYSWLLGFCQVTAIFMAANITM